MNKYEEVPQNGDFLIDAPEDAFLAAIADARVKKIGGFISHEEFWAKVMEA